MKPSLLLLLVVVSSLSTHVAALADGGGKGYVDRTGGFVIAIGYGEFPQGKMTVQGRSESFRLAETAARRILQETVKGVRIDSTTTVADLMLKDDIARSRVEAVLQSAVVTKRDTLVIDGAPLSAVEMRICLTSHSPECAQKPALLPEIFLDQRDAPLPEQGLTTKAQGGKDKPAPHPAKTSLPTGWKPARYDTSRPVTGVIIIVIGYDFEKEDFPVVVSGQNQSKIVYSVKSVDPQVVRTHGVVRYAVSLKEALGMGIAGENPVVIIALGVSNDNRIIIHANDAQALQDTLANGNDYLKNARVVVVK